MFDSDAVENDVKRHHHRHRAAAGPRTNPRRSRWVPSAWLLIAALLVPASIAHADVRTEARRHFRAGMALIQQGEVDAGVEELQEAYETLPHPNVLYNIARAYAEVGRYDEALEYFEMYMETDPPDREEVASFISAIQARVASSQTVAETTTTTETTAVLAAQWTRAVPNFRQSRAVS